MTRRRSPAPLRRVQTGPSHPAAGLPTARAHADLESAGRPPAGAPAGRPDHDVNIGNPRPLCAPPRDPSRRFWSYHLDVDAANSSPRYEERPWGSFTVLDEAEGYKVKRIEVHPGKRLSYQKHARRSEHWMVVQGTARVTLDGREVVVRAGEIVDVPIGTAHRVENREDVKLVFIEIQRGSYLGEDDIVRLQDDFGRAT